MRNALSARRPEVKRGLRILVVCVATLIFVVLGGLRRDNDDFAPVYASAKCLWHGCNAYSAPVAVYPPSTLLVISPLTVFPYPVAKHIWFALNAVSLVAAVVMILRLCPMSRRWLATIVGALLLAGSSQLLALGQPSAFAIALTIVGTCVFLRGRFLLIGAVLLMLSLAVKPQIGGLIVLYLFVRGVHRRYAGVAMVGAFALLIFGGLILRMNPQGINWVSDLRGNLSLATTPGGFADTRPNNKDAGAVLNLQAIGNVVLRDPEAVNRAAYVAFAILLTFWAVAALRMKASTRGHLLALAALSALTLMPVYHRSYDSRLLLLCIPAAVITLEKRRIVGALLCILVVLATVSIQHWAELLLLHRGLLENVQRDKALFILLLRESTIRVLLVFGLTVYAMFSVAPAVDSADLAADLISAETTP